MTWIAVVVAAGCTLVLASAINQATAVLRDLLTEQRTTNEHLHWQGDMISRIDDAVDRASPSNGGELHSR